MELIAGQPGFKHCNELAQLRHPIPVLETLSVQLDPDYVGIL
jgi:hypothetical protein